MRILDLDMNGRIHSFHIGLIQKKSEQRRVEGDIIDCSVNHYTEITLSHKLLFFPGPSNLRQITSCFRVSEHFHREIFLFLCDFPFKIHECMDSFSVDFLDNRNKAETLIDVNMEANTNKPQMKLTVGPSYWQLKLVVKNLGRHHFLVDFSRVEVKEIAEPKIVNFLVAVRNYRIQLSPHDLSLLLLQKFANSTADLIDDHSKMAHRLNVHRVQCLLLSFFALKNAAGLTKIA